MANSSSSPPQATVSACADHDLALTDLLNETVEGEKRNLLSVYCPRCPSLILRSGAGQYHHLRCLPLPNMEVNLKKNIGNAASHTDDVSVYQHFWAIADIFTFENVGYTNTVDGRYKYLTCADCECGPLGVQMLKDDDEDIAKGLKKNYSYLVLGRVVHR